MDDAINITEPGSQGFYCMLLTDPIQFAVAIKWLYFIVNRVEKLQCL